MEFQQKNVSRGARPYLSLSEAAPGDASDSAAAGYDHQVSGFAATGMLSPTSTAVPMTARSSIAGGTDFRSRQLAMLGPMRPQPTKIWRRKFVKVLVVGDSGLGKTTLISSLLSKPGEQLQVHDGTTTPLNQFMKDPDSLITRVTWKDEQDKIVWVFRVQDTPGYGDDQDISRHIELIVEHIESQNKKWLEMETAKDRCVDLVDVEDPRMDVCLYCLPPHRLRQNDVRYMAELSKHVPIIPVIMKADTMTIHEAQRFRQEVVNRLQNPMLAGIRGKIEMFNFSAATLERAGLPSSAATNIPPFVVIASNDINQEALSDEPPTYWPERSYKWGTAEAFNPDHSDLLFLRSLLMAEALEEIVVAKRQRYEDWRHRHLSTPLLSRLQRRIVRFLLASALPAAAIAFAAHHNFDRSKMGEALKEGGSKLKKKVLGDNSSSSSKKTAAAAAADALEAAPAPGAGSSGSSGHHKGTAAAALKEAEAALRAAEAAQKAALDELQRNSSKAAAAQPQQKKGWF